jgi:hypothetical protein
MTLSQQSNRDQDEEPAKKRSILTRGRALARRLKRPLIPIVGSLMFWWAARAAPAEAKFSHELTESPTYSLRPGMSRTEADDVLEGKVDVKELKESSSVIPGGTATKKPAAADKAKAKAKAKSIYGDVDDEDFEDEDFLADDDLSSSGTKATASQADQALAMAMQAKTSSQFATYRKGNPKSLYIKVSAGLFIPTFGAQIGREMYRRRREEEYVKKGLEILEAQKAEYFNVTSTTNDSDVEDALKGIKKGKDDDDDDDDDDNEDDDEDDDDEDDDDEEDDRRRRPPRRPRGGGDDDGDSGSGGGFDPGYGGPSEEDVDRLKNLFNKS